MHISRAASPMVPCYLRNANGATNGGSPIQPWPIIGILLQNFLMCFNTAALMLSYLVCVLELCDWNVYFRIGLECKCSLLLALFLLLLVVDTFFIFKYTDDCCVTNLTLDHA